VDLFFVLSGFLITGILLRTRDSRNYLSSFYGRRILRIFPLYLLTVFAYFVVALPLCDDCVYLPSSGASLQGWYWFHLSNWRSAFGQDVGLLAHFWSLSIEEQFYLVWPVVVLLAGPRWLPGIVCGMIVAPLGLRFAFANTQFGGELIHRLTPFRIDSLAVGCLVALIVRLPTSVKKLAPLVGWIAWISLGLFGALLVVTRASSPASYGMATLGYTLLAFLYGCLVFNAFTAAGSPAWLAVQLRRPWLRLLGKYSYAIYVFHWPIACFRNILLTRISETVSEGTFAIVWGLSLLGGMAVSFAAGLASWHLLEKHCLALKKWFVPESELARKNCVAEELTCAGKTDDTWRNKHRAERNAG
jgi:peptidoglycan/LPS O-acetylase OafA/YrhL